MERIATLVPAPEGGIFNTFSAVLRLPNGHFLVANDQQAGEIELYNSAGGYERTISRRGSGPGEYQYVKELFLISPDSIGVSDIALGRVTVLNPDLDAVRTWPQTFRHRDFIQLSSQRYLANAQVRSRDRVGLPLHIVDEGGEILRSFGTDTAIYRSDLTSINSRPITIDAEGMIWAGYAGQYVIDRYSPTGERLLRLVRNTDFFEPWVASTPVDKANPPPPQLSALRVDKGLIWTLVNVPNPRYHEFLSSGADGKVIFEPSDYYRFYHSVLEVIDPITGIVKASKHYPMFIFDFVDNDHVVGYREGPDLLPRLDIWRVTLSEGNR